MSLSGAVDAAENLAVNAAGDSDLVEVDGDEFADRVFVALFRESHAVVFVQELIERQVKFQYDAVKREGQEHHKIIITDTKNLER